MAGTMLLDSLHAWFESESPGFREGGLTISLSDSPADREKRSSWLDIEAGDNLGQLIVWESGELDVRARKRGNEQLCVDVHYPSVEAGDFLVEQAIGLVLLVQMGDFLPAEQWASVIEAVSGQDQNGASR